jgi:hypothetical protein
MPPKPKRQKQKQSRLMTIPIEIRLNIYGFVFGVDTAILEAQYIASENRNYSYLLHKQRSSQILQTCDKVYKEARVILFANTTFIVNTHADFHRLPHETSCLREPWMIKYLVWKIATNDLQKRWRTGDLHVSEILFPGLESMEIYCAGPTWESTRVLPSFTMTYEDGRTKVLLLGMSHMDGSRFKRLVEDSTCRGQIRLKLSRATDEPKRNVRTPFWSYCFSLLSRFRKSCCWMRQRRTRTWRLR